MFNYKKIIQLKLTFFIIFFSNIVFADNHNLNEILNPYVTTKKNGTGLGLSIVNKIINDHNGKLNFVSIPNGAKVEIIFNR